ncbi:hypothetical protein V6Z11_D11G242000 [Gossypium hirsutum]
MTFIRGIHHRLHVFFLSQPIKKERRNQILHQSRPLNSKVENNVKTSRDNGKTRTNNE